MPDNLLRTKVFHKIEMLYGGHCPQDKPEELWERTIYDRSAYLPPVLIKFYCNKHIFISLALQRL